MPEDSRVLLTRTKDGIAVTYAPTVEFCLSQIDDELHAELDLIVEDEVSKILLSEIIRAKCPEVIERIRILPVGPANIVKLFTKLCEEKKLPYKVLGIVDADQDETYELKLPGRFSPEKQLILDILNENHTNIIATLLNIRESDVKNIFENTTIIRNHNEWVNHAAKKLNISELSLIQYLALGWTRHCLTTENSERIVQKIKERLETSI